MNIRGYEPEDAETVCRLWNESLVQDRISIDNFYRRVVYDLNFDSRKLLIAEENDDALGFAYGVKCRFLGASMGFDDGQAWIPAFGVKPAARRKGVGRALLDSLEELLAKEGGVKIDVGPYPQNYFCPGIDMKAYGQGLDFFIANGYAKESECCSMNLNLSGYVTPEKYVKRKKALEDKGYIFKPYEVVDALGLFALASEDFPYWLNDIRASILGGRAEKTMILCQEKDTGATVGFVMRAMYGTPERFGPFGTKTSIQGKGIGAVLFHEMMENMVRDGVFYTYLLWAGGRNIDIYSSWGMSAYRVYAMVSKALPPANWRLHHAQTVK